MMKMAEKMATSAELHEPTEDRPIEQAQKKPLTQEPKLLPKKIPAQNDKKSRTGVLQKLGRLKPLLPVLSSGLRMVDHGAVQALAQLLHFIDGSATQSVAAEELHHGLAEIEANHRELRLQVQDQTVEMKRIEEQLTLLRQSAERTATEHAELVEDVKSLGNLVRTIGAGLAILLVVLITLTGLLLARH